MEINQFIFMLLMALHFAPSNANKINIELADNRKISFVKQNNDYWGATSKEEVGNSLFKLKGHKLLEKTGNKDEVSLSIEMVLGEEANNINWKEAKMFTDASRGSILFDRKKNGIDLIFSEDNVKSASDKSFKIRWETSKK